LRKGKQPKFEYKSKLYIPLSFWTEKRRNFVLESLASD